MSDAQIVAETLRNLACLDAAWLEANIAEMGLHWCAQHIIDLHEEAIQEIEADAEDDKEQACLDALEQAISPELERAIEALADKYISAACPRVGTVEISAEQLKDLFDAWAKS